MAFEWDANTIKRLQVAVRAYNQRITKRVNQYIKAGNTEYASILRNIQPAITVNDIKKQIHSVEDFERIVGYQGQRKQGNPSRLDRILASVDPDSLDIELTDDGIYQTRYSVFEYENDVKALRELAQSERENMSKPLYDGDKIYNTSTMSEPEKASYADSTDLYEDSEGESDDSYTDIDPQTKANWDKEDAMNKRSQVTPVAKYDNYIFEWTAPFNRHSELDNYQDMLNVLDWLVKNHCDVLNKHFNGGADEVEPTYLLLSGGPYENMGSFEERHSRAYKYWLLVAQSVGY